jgi:23S rRNA pseudouridine1911/1915/1917 synthase
MSTTVHSILLEAPVPSEYMGKRLDQVLALLFSTYSRSQLQRWVEAGFVQVDGEVANSIRVKVKGSEQIKIMAPALEQTEWQPQDLSLSIIFEDESLVVVNKPAGVVVHPAAGNREGTLVNALLHHYPELAVLPRAGLVHRLDKDTTGLLVVARTLEAYQDLVKQLQERRIKRDYFCIVKGKIISGGTIDAPLGRHPSHRTRRAVVSSGKSAVTHYRLMKRLKHFTGLQVSLETGRTHQIRVHFMHKGHPVIGDPVYGGKKYIPREISLTLKTALEQWHRQALHAQRLALTHPVNKTMYEWTAPLPADLQVLWDVLQEEDA